MYISALNDTCSMYEISDCVEISFKDNIINKEEFFKHLSKHDSDTVNNEFNKIKVFIYNTLYESDYFKTSMKKIGFKKVHSYIGNTNNRLVTTYIFNFNERNRKLYCKVNKLNYNDLMNND